jgi:hypothetical protein
MQGSPLNFLKWYLVTIFYWSQDTSLLNVQSLLCKLIGGMRPLNKKCPQS